jgi:hypothetical protein
VARSDFNGDGYSDILLANYGANWMGYWDMGAERGLYEPQFQDMGWFAGGAWSAWGHGDYNGDGYSDVLSFNVDTNMAGWTDMNGGVVSNWTYLGDSSSDWWIVPGDQTDLTGDGSDDIIWMNVATGQLGYWDMEGGNIAAWRSLYSQDFNVLQIVGGDDFNADGTDDILWQNTQTGHTALWLMNNGNAAQFVDLGAHGTVVATGDFQGDGSAEIVWHSNGEFTVGEIENGDLASVYETGISSSQMSIEAIGDYDADGRENILVRFNEAQWGFEAGDVAYIGGFGIPHYVANFGGSDWLIV